MRKYNPVILIFLLIFFNSAISCAKDKIDTNGKGYLGTLPELTKDYGVEDNYKEQEQKSIPAIPSKDFNSENEIKPIPNDDPAFVNMILKTDKTSKYANDLNEFIITLENIYDMIEDNENVQLFNAKVFYFNKLVDYFRDKYADKPESQFISYKRIIELSIHARSIALLRNEAERYNPYLAYGGAGYIYNPNNIEEQLGYLKTEIQQTILLIRESQ
ncbi:hypothetical protein J6G99_02620 [bacterium]|nr:hypothetical protein [bacterium]